MRVTGGSSSAAWPLALKLLTLLTLAPAPGAHAAGAHVHGQGQLDIAVDDGRVELLLTAPLSDLDSGTDGGGEALTERFGTADLFGFAGADCSLEASSIDEVQDDGDWFDESSEQDEEQHASGAAHHGEAGHDEDADHHDAAEHHAGRAHHDEDGDHEHGDHHADADDDDHSGHKDLALTWVYACSKDPRSVRVELFDATRLKKIKVQAIGAGGATAATLTARARDVELP